MKQLIKSTAQCIGFDVVRYVPEFNRPFAVLPLVVREKLRTGADFFFVQVGAHDGVLDDPLRSLIMDHQLPGLMIEPLPDLFTKLCANYAGCPNLIFENVAVDTAEGTRLIYRAAKDAPLSPYWQGCSSFDRAHVIKEGVPEAWIESVTVHAVTLPALLQKHNISTVSLLQVDAEGYDHIIVNAALDAGILPEVINYEHCHLFPKVRLACKQLLDRHGYKFIEIGKDTLAVREE